jgi:hypothetical protein
LILIHCLNLLQLAEAEKEVKRAAFERALATPDEPGFTEQVVLEDIAVDASYSGPRMEGEWASRGGWRMFGEVGGGVEAGWLVAFRTCHAFHNCLPARRL